MTFFVKAAFRYLETTAHFDSVITGRGEFRTLATLLSVSLLITADWRACSRASTRPSHSRSLCRASAPSELTFLQGKWGSAR